jgi:hypothetical protein
MVKGSLKVLFSFILVMVVFAGILVIPVNAESDKPETADRVLNASPQPIIPPLEYATPPAAVFIPEPPEPFVVILDEEVPTAPMDPFAPAALTDLPRTGGIPAGVFYGFGGFITIAGLILRTK